MSRKLSEVAQCAKSIRTELKKRFPNFKFKVKSESFAGGTSVNILWFNGPTIKQVENITNKYQYGHFNGMTDSYECSNKREDIPQARFISTSRILSLEGKYYMVALLERDKGIKIELETYYDENIKRDMAKVKNLWEPIYENKTAVDLIHQISIDTPLNFK